jgi:predicted pyridoxine 5'-phosphate oxidase superfamily flavin-nucleotide-binding protein
MGRFHELAFTPLVKEQQVQHNSRNQYERMQQNSAPGNVLGPQEQAFVQLRDSFYMASVSETGWPYVQHRGGPAGFVKVLDPKLLGFADLRGNKQYISLGNLLHDSRVALFFMDYPNQTRLKILGRVEVREVGVHEQDAVAPDLIASLRTSEPGAVIERAILIHVEGFDWNCPQHITPRYTLEELEPSLAPLRNRLKELEAENASLRKLRL